MRLNGERRMPGGDRRLLGIVPALAVCLMMFGLSMCIVPASAKIDVKLAYVDIGNDEMMALLYGWGPEQPDTSGGGWGGYGGTDQSTRVIWYDEYEGYGEDPNGRDAEIQILFTGSARTITYKHLDGIADDSFELYAYDKEYNWFLIDWYDDQGGTEQWHERTVDLTKYMSPGECEIILGGGYFVLKFVATGDMWDAGWSTYGQVAIDHITIRGNGVAIPE